MYAHTALLLLVIGFATAAGKIKISREDCTSEKVSRSRYQIIDVYYDNYFEKCITPVKGRCDSWSKAKCPQYAECRTASDNQPRCGCKDRLSISEDGLGCVLAESNDGPCILNVSPDSNGCNIQLGLACLPDETSGNPKKGKCGCGEDKIWNNVTDKCMPKDCSKRIWGVFLDAKSGNCYMELLKEFRMTDIANHFITCPPGAEAKLNLPSRTMH